ncbi:hypothetical protein GCWU000246_01074 [Jonquetella anthropi E3_33 E1]|nr:hypothetical protein GCWU000246_01074 [Jonquetella anthropi E3_33 E1]
MRPYVVISIFKGYLSFLEGKGEEIGCILSGKADDSSLRERSERSVRSEHLFFRFQ